MTFSSPKAEMVINVRDEVMKVFGVDWRIGGREIMETR
jgi:hypothetical protein